MTEIERIKKELETCFLIQSDEEGRRRNEAVALALVAIDYRKARKPYWRRVGSGLRALHCPTCNGVLQGANPPNFCSHCGQKLSKEEERRKMAIRLIEQHKARAFGSNEL